jgi:acyl-CoA synthetase (AMP-forming)/AMP-acid ligase II
VTALGRDDHRTDSEEGLRRLRSVGRPLPGEEVMVCDELGNPLGPGRNGELWIRGANTVQGYFRDPEQTRENFTDNGFWRSGDIGYMDELGYVYLIDRKKDLIISGGYNVYATEVENCLNSHPAVQNSAVVGVPDEEWGEAVRAVVVLASGRRAQEAELIEHCKQRLARHKAPKAVAVVDELPVSPAGKVLRREVRRRLVEPD